MKLGRIFLSTTKRRLLPFGFMLAIASLVACGPGSGSGSLSGPAPEAKYDSLPPVRVSSGAGNVVLPETIPLIAINPAIQARATMLAAEEVAPQRKGLTPISLVDPIVALGGRSVVNNFKPGNQADLRVVAGMEDQALPTGKWYKGFFYQSPRNLEGDFGGDRGIGQNSVYAFPNRLYLDDRIGMVTIGFPHKHYIRPGDSSKLGNFTNRYINDDYLYSIEPDTRPDVFVTYAAPAAGRLNRRIDRQDELSVTTSWNSGSSPATSSQSMQLIAVNGSPYVTLKYKNLRPIVGMGEAIIPRASDSKQWQVAANIKSVGVDNGTPTEFAENITGKTPALSGKKFRFVYSMADDSLKGSFTQRVMVVYASQNLTLNWDSASRAYTANSVFTGVLRVAFVDEQAEATAPSGTVVTYTTRESLLDQYANEYPVAGNVNLQYEGAANASVRYSWQTETLDGTPSVGAKLMMMAFDATHLKSMANPTTVGLDYRSNFGRMTGVIGSSWTQTLVIPQILRDSTDREQKDLWLGTGTIKASDRGAILASLKKDAAIAKEYISNCNYESYLCGKHIGNIARMALIAHQLGENADRDDLLDFLKQNITPWFDGKDDSDPRYQQKIKDKIRDYFQYDTVNRGVVTLRPFSFNDFSQDFYNAVYVDHMFHYGYYIYGAAVLARFDSKWREKYKEPVNTLVRDIANASSEDKKFPITRTYDWFKMQNMADSGPTDKGGNTESSSEAINSGYAIVLWGAVTGNGELQALASIMAAGEIRTAQAFYQVTPENNVFPDVSAVTVPVVGGNGGRTSSLPLDPSKVSTFGIKYQSVTQHQVFFGAQRMFRIGIQFLPISPISEYVISPAWAKIHEAALLQLEQDQTALYEDIFKFTPQDGKALCSKDVNLVTDQNNPGGVCAGYARTLYSWRQIIASGNGVNDADGTWTRYLKYVNQVDQQTADFAKLTVGSPFRQAGDGPNEMTGRFGPAGISVDIFKDLSTPSNNTNVLWWLATRKK